MHTLAPLVDWGFILVVLLAAGLIGRQIVADLLGALRRARADELDVTPRSRSQWDLLGELDQAHLSIELLSSEREQRRQLRARRRSA
jgi:hypothetical protein